jgi:hypothetical protein
MSVRRCRPFSGDGASPISQGRAAQVVLALGYAGRGPGPLDRAPKAMTAGPRSAQPGVRLLRRPARPRWGTGPGQFPNLPGLRRHRGARARPGFDAAPTCPGGVATVTGEERRGAPPSEPAAPPRAGVGVRTVGTPAGRGTAPCPKPGGTSSDFSLHGPWPGLGFARPPPEAKARHVTFRWRRSTEKRPRLSESAGTSRWPGPCPALMIGVFPSQRRRGSEGRHSELGLCRPGILHTLIRTTTADSGSKAEPRNAPAATEWPGAGRAAWSAWPPGIKSAGPRR